MPRGDSRNRVMPDRLSPGGQSIPSNASAGKHAINEKVEKKAEKGKGIAKETTGQKRGPGKASEERENSSKKARKNEPEVFNVDKILNKRVDKGK